MSDPDPREHVPVWVTVLIVLACLPLLAYPALLSHSPAGTDISAFMWCYPVYVVLSGVCAWFGWRRSHEITWILLVMMLLTHAAMWYLVGLI